ncbi:MAG: cytochrome c biogenesis protein ResB [Coriobacteriia bacterium]|nr:cytochrome c biogenesis protein ResB [Coriobacteriia bacterium]
MSRIYDALRSRRLATFLLGACAAWATAATIVPQRGAEGSVPVSGALGAFVRVLGLDHAFSSAPFIALTVALFASTVACSVERTRAARRVIRRASSEDVLVRLPGRAPDAAVKIGCAGDPVHCIEQALRRSGLRVRAASESTVYASSSKAGALGSPAFHWLLAGLIVLVGLGQLTRAEGLMGVPVGSARVDRAESYGVLSRGPLHREFTRLTIAVSALDLSHVVGGVDRGASPFVELYDGPVRLAGAYVYPNHPLRYKSLVVHANDYGLHLPIAGEGGVATDVLLDFDTEACVARSVSWIEASTATDTARISLSIPLDSRGGACVPAVPREPRIEWRAEGEAGVRSGVAKPGATFEPLPGVVLEAGEVGYYARLSVVDDWSVFPLYAVFVLATAALAVAVFAPFREALVTVEREDDGAMAFVFVRHSRRDPSFGQRVLREIEKSAGASATEERKDHDD